MRTRRPSHRCLQYNGTSRSTPWRLQSPHPFSREWALRWLHGRDLQQVGLSRCGTRSMRRASMAAAPQGQLTRSEVDDCLNPYACIIGEWSCVLSWGVSREGQAGARELNSSLFKTHREAHEGRGPLSRYLSHARLHLALSRHSLGIGSRGPTPRGAGSRLVFFLSALASRFSRDSRPRESTPVDYYSWTRRLSWTRVYRHTKKLIRISHHAVSILAT